MMTPEVKVTPIVSVSGGSGLRLHAREDSPRACCVLEAFEKQFFFGREYLPLLIEMFQAFQKQLDETYGTYEDRYKPLHEAVVKLMGKKPRKARTTKRA